MLAAVQARTKVMLLLMPSAPCSVEVWISSQMKSAPCGAEAQLILLMISNQAL
jgi:hypothetical protein